MIPEKIIDWIKTDFYGQVYGITDIDFIELFSYKNPWDLVYRPYYLTVIGKKRIYTIPAVGLEYRPKSCFHIMYKNDDT